MGKGTCFFTQLDALSRYERDPVATRYIQNVISYAVSEDILKYANRIKRKQEKNEHVIEKLIKYIDLEKFANQSFKDKEAGDRKGGWDDGGDNDLRNFPVGEQKFLGVPFQIIDGKKNNEKSCIMLKGTAVQSLPVEVKKVPVESYLTKMYFLYTSTFTGSKKGREIGKFIILYGDGQKFEIPLVVGKNILDWWKPAELQHARVAWYGSNSKHTPIGVYMLKWENPFTGKLVKSISFKVESEKGPQLVWIAATAERVDPAKMTHIEK